MARKKREHRATQRPERKTSSATAPAPAPQDSDLDAAPRALLEPEVDDGQPPDPMDQGSVQDPLRDWPELEEERDEWTLERPAKGIEK